MKIIRVEPNKSTYRNPWSSLSKSDQVNLCAYIDKHLKMLQLPFNILSDASSIKPCTDVTKELVRPRVTEEYLWDERALDLHKEKEITDAQQTHFWELQKQLNNVTAKVPSYKGTCAIRGPNFHHPYRGSSAERRSDGLQSKEHGYSSQLVWQDGVEV